MNTLNGLVVSNMVLQDTKAIYHFFIGPTLFNNFQLLLNHELYIKDTIKIYPPIQRRDVENLTLSYSPSTLIIVDGVYHSCPSVGHVEIRTAIELGWKIWGLSSMGAIRAAEMSCLGMKGFGKVYRMFSIYKDFRDDEVALLHGIDEPYFPLSEPLIHLRLYLKDLKRNRIINEKTYWNAILYLENIYFGNRTINLTNSLILDTQTDLCKRDLEYYTSNFEKYRIKAQDLFNFITSEIWK